VISTVKLKKCVNVIYFIWSRWLSAYILTTLRIFIADEPVKLLKEYPEKCKIYICTPEDQAIYSVCAYFSSCSYTQYASKYAILDEKKTNKDSKNSAQEPKIPSRFKNILPRPL